MLGIRQPLDGPVFQKLKDAEHGCIHAMIDHYDRPLGMSDACIEPFRALVAVDHHRTSSPSGNSANL
jgi:hypothetical protein